jgi:hypothetical protein
LFRNQVNTGQEDDVVVTLTGQSDLVWNKLPVLSVVCPGLPVTVAGRLDFILFPSSFDGVLLVGKHLLTWRGFCFLSGPWSSYIVLDDSVSEYERELGRTNISARAIIVQSSVSQSPQVAKRRRRRKG